MSLITDPMDPLHGIDIDPNITPPEDFSSRSVQDLLSEWSTAPVDEHGHSPLVIGRDGQPEAVLLPFDEYLDLLRASIVADERAVDAEILAANDPGAASVGLATQEDVDEFLTSLGGYAAHSVQVDKSQRAQRLAGAGKG